MRFSHLFGAAAFSRERNSRRVLACVQRSLTMLVKKTLFIGFRRAVQSLAVSYASPVAFTSENRGGAGRDIQVHLARRDAENVLDRIDHHGQAVLADMSLPQLHVIGQVEQIGGEILERQTDGGAWVNLQEESIRNLGGRPPGDQPRRPELPFCSILGDVRPITQTRLDDASSDQDIERRKTRDLQNLPLEPVDPGPCLPDFGR